MEGGRDAGRKFFLFTVSQRWCLFCIFYFVFPHLFIKQKKRNDGKKSLGDVFFLYSFSVREEREGLWEKSGLYKFPGFMEK